MKRQPAVAGQFYSDVFEELKEQIEKCFISSFGPRVLPDKETKKEDLAPFLLVPHAGYMYSGPVAAWSYYELSKYKKPDTVIIIGPNHRGIGSDIAVPEVVTKWETPLGVVNIDTELVEELCATDAYIGRSDASHTYEHSIEVQVPFLQYLYSDSFKLLPITLMKQGYGTSKKLGQLIGDLIQERNIIVIASSDFTHFEHHDQAAKKDGLILEAIEKMDTQKMWDIRDDQRVTMCGHGPIVSTIEAALKTGRSTAKLLKYATSGDVSGRKNEVVGYGAGIFYK